jgi:hypothetical protein
LRLASGGIFAAAGWCAVKVPRICLRRFVRDGCAPGLEAAELPRVANAVFRS